MQLIRSDLDFILAQIRFAETGGPLDDPSLPFGLRTVDGRNNSVVPGQSDFGAADRVFPRMTDPCSAKRTSRRPTPRPPVQ